MTETLRPTPALLAHGLEKVYAGGARALDRLHLTIPPGSFFGLLGPNGAGKSTLIGAAAGLVRVAPGHLEVFGHDAVREAAAVRQLIGLAPQEVHLDRFLTAREGLVYHGRYFGLTKKDARGRADELLAAFDLADKAEVRPNRLSGGMRRRLLIARALVHRPPLLVLDEPTAGVDLELRHELWRYLRRLHAEEDATILLTTHYIEEAEALCDHIAFIRAGRIAAEGSPAGLVAGFGVSRLEDVYLAIMGEEALSTEPLDSPLPAGAHAEYEPSARRAMPAVLDPAVPVGGGARPNLALVQRRGTAALAGREVRRVLTLASQTILPPVVTALVYLLVFGGALGARLRQVQGVDYLSFVLPGLLVMTVAGQSFGNNATSIFQAKYEGYIEDVLSSPLRPWRMAVAFMAGGLVRSGLTVAILVLVVTPFTHAIVDPLLAVAALALSGLVFAALGVVTGIWAETFDQLSFVANLVIAPLALLAGVFYSAGQLPGVWAVLTRLDPIYYLVTAARSGFLGLAEGPVLLSLALAGLTAVGLFMLAVGLLTKGWRLKP